MSVDVIGGTFAAPKPAGIDSPSVPRPPGGILPNPLIDDLRTCQVNRGVLIPLKTTQEVRQDHTIVHALITRAPTKAANDVITALRDSQAESSANTLPHLRRCAKPTDLPAHLKTQFMNDTPTGRQIHTAKSNWIYIIVGEAKDFNSADVTNTLGSIEGLEQTPFIAEIPVPLLAPTSQIQAAMWSSQFWPTVYRKNNPLGPHPSMVARGTDDIKGDASVWLALAHRVALQAKESGIGEAIGAVVVQRDERGAQLVGLAGDARRHQESGGFDLPGNPMTHCVLRAISMVAQKLVRHERRAAGQVVETPNLAYDAFQDAPLIELERQCLEQEHPNKDGYLCHGLELYTTHEPCVECSMGILHSRMGKVVFANHMARTGGLSSDDRPDGGGRGLGLFWRRELNWSLMAWEWERDGVPELPPIDPTTHVTSTTLVATRRYYQRQGQHLRDVQDSSLERAASRARSSIAPRGAPEHVSAAADLSIFRFLTSVQANDAAIMNKRRDASAAAGASNPSKKRKVDSLPKFYAVKAGFLPGVYENYADCQAQTAGFKGALFKSFTSKEDAEAFVAGRKVASSSDEPPKFYAVAVGDPTGIFTDWSEASLSIKGVKGPKYKRFGTRLEAVDYIKQNGSREAIEAIGEKADPVAKPTKRTKAAAKDAVVTIPVKDDALRVYTDGSSPGNGRDGARAGVGVFFGINDPRNLSERLQGEPQTNQRAELMAALRAMEIVQQEQAICIISDSAYTIKCLTQWGPAWKSKNWVTASGAPVKNLDIIKPALEKIQERERAGARTDFKWVKGHDNDPGNEAADRLAKRGADLPF
ncbi:Ribonuclease H [Paramyrothecium foliicola]|nr:Ribonuclease H [Paramyrothecium foliicola]